MTYLDGTVALEPLYICTGDICRSKSVDVFKGNEYEFKINMRE